MCLASLLWPGIPLLSSHTYAHNMSGEDVCIPWIFSFWLAFTMQASTALEAQQMFEAQRTSDDAMKAGRTVGSVPAPSPAVLLRIRLHQSIYVAMSSPCRANSLISAVPPTLCNRPCHTQPAQNVTFLRVFAQHWSIANCIYGTWGRRCGPWIQNDRLRMSTAGGATLPVGRSWWAHHNQYI